MAVKSKYRAILAMEEGRMRTYTLQQRSHSSALLDLGDRCCCLRRAIVKASYAGAIGGGTNTTRDLQIQAQISSLSQSFRAIIEVRREGGQAASHLILMAPEAVTVGSLRGLGDKFRFICRVGGDKRLHAISPTNLLVMFGGSPET